jgi:tRNA(Arg) A34 adenosine deaminase TadA
MRAAIQVAWKARANGNHPFGAVLADDRGNIVMEAENTVATERDCTGHAETNLVRQAARSYDADFLSRCTLYASTEPCPMCSGAIFWANIRRVVFGLSQAGIYELVGPDNEEALRLSCREVMDRGAKAIEVVGPLLEDEAREVQIGFWT